MKKIEYKVEKSKYPEENRTHLVVRYSMTEHGLSSQRVFKGTFQQCKAEKERLTKR